MLVPMDINRTMTAIHASAHLLLIIKALAPAILVMNIAKLALVPLKLLVPPAILDITCKMERILVLFFVLLANTIGLEYKSHNAIFVMLAVMNA